MADKKTAIVTGASQGIGAGLVEAFLIEGYNVVATSRHVTQSLTASPRLDAVGVWRCSTVALYSREDTATGSSTRGGTKRRISER